MRALITGGAGFAGTHLAKHLVDCRDDVALTYLPISSSDVSTDRKNIFKLEEERKGAVPKSVQHVALDVTNTGQVRQVLSLMQPDVLYHLAAMSFVPEAENKAEEALRVNGYGTYNLLKILKEFSPATRFLYVSTSEVYGVPRPGSLPLLEQAEIRPLSSYAVSKALGEHFAHKFSASENLFVVTVRPFPHVGPFQEDRFSLSSFAKQIALISLGRKEPIIEVGNIEVKRDFSDVSDIVRGYREAVLNGRNGEVYNLCSGISSSLSDLIKRMMKLAGVEAEIHVSDDRVRSSDISEHFGSSNKANRDFGWRPRVELDAMLNGILSYWLESLSL
ncbi:MAG TPA: GDP-mannose 4,6-dehydratase [Oligoflexia bacterium]|nr:GDP-mannose 4,6-dehydratase [Oligoflexia bacterium]HMP49154.1 GDP-mannose 4,6-dehydratase [Oligoflexia bacterium]